jgi:hypothetical protein
VSGVSVTADVDIPKLPQRGWLASKLSTKATAKVTLRLMESPTG